MRDFDATVRNYRAALTRRCARMCRSGWMDPEDLQQEFWLDVAKMWPRIEPDVGITALLFQILRSTVSRLIRARNTRSRTGFEVPLEDWDGGAVAADQETAVELSRAIDAIDRLPDRQRQVLVARALGEELGEIGDRMGVTRQRVNQIETTARQRLLKAKKRVFVQPAPKPPGLRRKKPDKTKVAEIRAKLRRGASYSTIADEFGISGATVSLIATGKTWQHVA